MHDRREPQSPIRRVFLPVFRSEDYSPEALARRWLFYTQGPDGFKQGTGLRARACTISRRLNANLALAP